MDRSCNDIPLIFKMLAGQILLSRSFRSTKLAWSKAVSGMRTSWSPRSQDGEVRIMDFKHLARIASAVHISGYGTTSHRDIPMDVTRYSIQSGLSVSGLLMNVYGRLHGVQRRLNAFIFIVLLSFYGDSIHIFDFPEPESLAK